MKHIHIAAQTGVGFIVKAGEIIRVIDVEGGQVADLVCFALQNTVEHFSSGRTVDYNNKLFYSTGDVLYSNRSRPMLTIVNDEVGGHTCLYAPCSQEMFEKRLTGIIQLRDMFGKVIRDETSSGVDFYSYGEEYNRAPQVSLTLNYRFNNFKSKEERNGGGGFDEF